MIKDLHTGYKVPVTQVLVFMNLVCHRFFSYVFNSTSSNLVPVAAFWISWIKKKYVASNKVIKPSASLIINSKCLYGNTCRIMLPPLQHIRLTILKTLHIILKILTVVTLATVKIRIYRNVHGPLPFKTSAAPIGNYLSPSNRKWKKHVTESPDIFSYYVKKHFFVNGIYYHTQFHHNRLKCYNL